MNLLSSPLLAWLVAAVPRNSFLANSPWPCVHADPYCSATSSIPTITPKDVATYRVHLNPIFSKIIRGTLSLYWISHDSPIAWASSLYSIYKLNTDTMEIVDSITKPGATDKFRGIYSFVDSQGRFYTCSNLSVYLLAHEIPDDPSSKIVSLNEFRLESTDNGETIVSVNMLYSGEVGFLTTGGRVGVISNDLTELIDLMTMPVTDVLAAPEAVVDLDFDGMSQKEISDNLSRRRAIVGSAPRGHLVVTNSMSIDEFNGMYIVTARHLYRLVYDPILRKIIGHHHGTGSTFVSGYDLSRGSTVRNVKQEYADNRSTEGLRPANRAWTREYEYEPYPLELRLSKNGSGTTPTLFEYEDTLYVVICDGKYLQNVTVYEALTGRLIDSVPVTFGFPKTIESYTEQSLAAANGEFVVVQNAATERARKLHASLAKYEIDVKLSSYNATESAVNRIAGNSDLASIALGDSPVGIQKFGLDRVNGQLKLVTRWINKSSGCPNSIPMYNSNTNILYCVSKVSSLSKKYPKPFEGMWSISGYSWVTGEKLLDIRTGSDIRYNTLFSAVQVGPRGDIFHGSVGGIVKAHLLPHPRY